MEPLNLPPSRARHTLTSPPKAVADHVLRVANMTGKPVYLAINRGVELMVVEDSCTLGRMIKAEHPDSILGTFNEHSPITDIVAAICTVTGTQAA